MSFLRRVRQGLVGAALLGMERGVAEAVEVRARNLPTREGGEISVATTAREDLEVGLPVGETDLEDILKDGDMKKIFGVSVNEMRYMAGIDDPFGECGFDAKSVSYEDTEFFREVRNKPAALKDPKARRSILEAVERAGVEAPNNEYRQFGMNPRPRAR